MHKISEKIQKILGENCLAIYTARPKFFYVTLVIVIDKYPFSSLQKIKEVLQKNKTRYILLTKKEIIDSSDVFPLHFLSIKKTRNKIFGTDVFEKIKIKNSDIRRKLEYDIRNKNIYLRQESLNIPAVQIIENVLPELFPAFFSLAQLLEIGWSPEKYTDDEYKKLLELIEKQIPKNKNLSIFIDICNENFDNWTEKESLDILKEMSISLENIADFVNDL